MTFLSSYPLFLLRSFSLPVTSWMLLTDEHSPLFLNLMFKISVSIVTQQPYIHNGNYIPTSINSRVGKVFFYILRSFALLYSVIDWMHFKFLPKGFRFTLYIHSLFKKNIYSDRFFLNTWYLDLNDDREVLEGNNSILFFNTTRTAEKTLCPTVLLLYIFVVFVTVTGLYSYQNL